MYEKLPTWAKYKHISIFNTPCSRDVLFADFPQTLLSALQNSEFQTFASDLVDEDLDAAPKVLARLADPTVVQVCIFAVMKSNLKYLFYEVWIFFV